ncbi:hypothetical protein [Arachidicoccus sp.]|uniref:hypothetical protein n=1 Tax=Arachidicoccus sp. TaxID=1872624 RepID=UPI003D23EF01
MPSKEYIAKGQIAGSKNVGELNRLVVNGIQITSFNLTENDPLCIDTFKRYLLRFPRHLTMLGTATAIQLNQLKLTADVVRIIQRHFWRREENGVAQFEGIAFLNWCR